MLRWVLQGSPHNGDMRTPVDYVRGVWHPEVFHGRGVHRGYFEGWFITLVSADLSQRWAVIPGVFRGLAGEGGERDEAFVQVLDGLTGRSWYHRFAPEQFAAESGRFAVTVGKNRFDAGRVDLPLARWGVRGFIAGLRHSGRLHRWTAYNRARGRRLVRWSIEGRDGVIESEI